MTQHREAPAYQEYASSLMARIEYRVMSMEARGLFVSMRLECWVNGSVPSVPAMLARVLGYPVEQIERTLPEVGAFVSEEGGALRCPELDDYRAHLQDRRDKQAAGGRAGAAKTNSARTGSAPSRPSGRATGKPRVPRESLVKTSPEQPSQAKRLQGEAINDRWINEYERASKGN
jgi:hypothetical protein